VSAKFTLPYSLFNGIDYSDLINQEAYKQRYVDTTPQDTDDNFGVDGVYINQGDFIKTTTKNGVTGLVRVDDYQDADSDIAKVDQEKFKWLEYYKIKFKADWYTRLIGPQTKPLVLRALGEFGYLGAYTPGRGTTARTLNNSSADTNRGVVPFERFFLGGDGLANFALDGREVIQLRGYPNQSLSSTDGDPIYNKFSLEFRYPITLKAAASIYALTFIEAGASYNSFKNYNPFVLQRSAGFGIRIFMPAFGLLGIDFANGFDPIPGFSQPNGWETHFIIGQQF
jgi:outer membrane protein insertion porin family